MGVVHGREEVRLLEVETRGMRFEQRQIVLEDAPLVELRPLMEGEADDGVQRETAAKRLLHEVPALEVVEGARASRAYLGQGEERRFVGVVPAHVREHGEQPARHAVEPLPGPIDEKRHFRKVVFVAHRADAIDPCSAQPIRERAYTDGA